MLASFRCTYSRDTVLGALAKGSSLHGFRSLLLGNDLARIELDEHRAVGFNLLDGHGESEIVEKKELQFQMVELRERQSTNLMDMLVSCTIDQTRNPAYLCVSRICVEDVREEFAGACDASNDQSVNVEAVHHKKVGQVVGINGRRVGW